MAELLSIIAATVFRVAATFFYCVDAYEYIQFRRSFGRDFQTEMLALNCIRIKVSRWAQAIDIGAD